MVNYLEKGRMVAFFILPFRACSYVTPVGNPVTTSIKVYHSKSNKEKIKQEYAMNQLIRKITGHERWARAMEIGVSHPYQTMFDYDPSILVCLENAKKTSEEFDKIAVC